MRLVHLLLGDGAAVEGRGGEVNAHAALDVEALGDLVLGRVEHDGGRDGKDADGDERGDVGLLALGPVCLAGLLGSACCGQPAARLGAGGLGSLPLPDLGGGGGLLGAALAGLLHLAAALLLLLLELSGPLGLVGGVVGLGGLLGAGLCGALALGGHALLVALCVLGGLGLLAMRLLCGLLLLLEHLGSGLFSLRLGELRGALLLLSHQQLLNLSGSLCFA